MASARDAQADFLAQHHPFDVLPDDALATLLDDAREERFAVGAELHAAGVMLDNLFVLRDGAVDELGDGDEVLEHRVAGECIGARSLLRGAATEHRAVVAAAATALVIPKATFLTLVAEHLSFAAFYERLRRRDQRRGPRAMTALDGHISSALRDIMTPDPIAISTHATIQEAAARMRDHKISCLLVTVNDRLEGILTSGDLTTRVLAQGRELTTPVGDVMTAQPVTLGPDILVFDAILSMSEYDIGHLPVVENGRPVGIVTQTNLIRNQSVSTIFMIGEIGRHDRIEDLARVVAQVPQLLAQLVGAGVAAHKVADLITSVTDALTRRLLTLAEAELGPPPVPYLWLACGSQGRREQTGISDQDNCLILHDSYDAAHHDAYFTRLADIVCDGLDQSGYYYCPGEMMAKTPRWRQPLKVWREYFERWIQRPDPMAQMLSSVMFDLRPIGGDTSLFEGLQRETSRAARRNSIFRAHMVANSLGHLPPLNVFRGFAVIRSGEHKNRIDLKLNGVVPIVDLARVYALDAGLEEVGTRERIKAARNAGSLSEAGAADLLDAYDTVARLRLEHQAKQIRAGDKADNFLAPSSLSALERGHLKDAFGVVKSLQSALGHARSAT